MVDRKEKIEAIRARLKERARAYRVMRKSTETVVPPPRYNEVYEQGVKWLDSLADEVPMDDSKTFQDQIEALKLVIMRADARAYMWKLLQQRAVNDVQRLDGEYTIDMARAEAVQRIEHAELEMQSARTCIKTGCADLKLLEARLTVKTTRWDMRQAEIYVLAANVALVRATEAWETAHAELTKLLNE